MNKLVMIGLVWLAGIAVSDALADSPSTIDSEALNEPVNGGGLFAEGCNRALHMRVTEWAVHDEYAGQAPPPGQRWLALELEVENRMPADLIFDLDYEEAVLIASLTRQGYLLVDGQRVSRRTQFDRDTRAIDDGFVLGRIGDTRQGSVVYAIPASGIDTLSFHYYHDDYAALSIPLLGEMATAARRAPADNMPMQGNDLMEIAVVSVKFPDRLHGQAPPEGMSWLAVDLRGRSRWENPADALALDRDAAIDAKVDLPHVMEYVEAGGLLQAVVDGGHGYVRDAELSSLLDDPVWLPEFMAGGIAVFPVPEGTEHIELVTYFPEFRAAGISSDIRPPLRFTLLDDAAPTDHAEPLALIEDEPTPVSIHALDFRDRFAGHQAAEGEVLLLVEASMTNLSGVGGMMAVSQRLRPLAPEGELVGAYQRGPVELVEPFWLPANDEPRHFMLLYRFVQPAEEHEFAYGGVSVNSQISLPVGD
ncbi:MULTISPECIES: hypothetical protein [unclassified Halomonas]|uniref:hypothetical protein n=1 Tax=unclassified Halomonas TaxID=2609666 RepID=UPI0040343682